MAAQLSFHRLLGVLVLIISAPMTSSKRVMKCSGDLPPSRPPSAWPFPQSPPWTDKHIFSSDYRTVLELCSRDGPKPINLGFYCDGDGWFPTHDDLANVPKSYTYACRSCSCAKSDDNSSSDSAGISTLDHVQWYDTASSSGSTCYTFGTYDPASQEDGGPSENAQSESGTGNSEERGSQALEPSAGAASSADSKGPGPGLDATTSVTNSSAPVTEPQEGCEGFRRGGGRRWRGGRSRNKGKAGKAGDEDEDEDEAESAAANATSSSTSSAATPPPSTPPSPNSPNPPPSAGQNPPSSDFGSSSPPADKKKGRGNRGKGSRARYMAAHPHFRPPGRKQCQASCTSVKDTCSPSASCTCMAYRKAPTAVLWHGICGSTKPKIRRRQKTPPPSHADLDDPSFRWDEQDVLVDEDGEEMACPCNGSYVSYGCCGSATGVIWEPAHWKLGELALEL